MKLETKALSDLHPADYNPRTISAEARRGLEESIKRFGLVQPIVWNERTGNVVSGHQRLTVLRAQGAEETTVVVVDLDPIEERALNITQNNAHIAGEFDATKLQDLLVELQEMAPDMLKPLRLDELVVPLDEPAEAQEVDVPDGAEPRTRPGDLWLLGDHRLLCGDSTSEADVARLMDGQLADMVFTDPPYGVEIVGGSHVIPAKDRIASGCKSIQNDKPSDIEMLTSAFMVRLMEHTRPGACWYVCITPAAVGLHFANALVDYGVFHQQLVWNKNSLTIGLADYQPKHELILYGWTPGAAHRRMEDRTQTTVWDINRPSRSEDHPTMKPVELVSKAVVNSSIVGELVLDLFGGSGTTLIASEQLGRKCCMMELDPHYCDVIVPRWEKLTGNTAVREAAR